MNTRKLRLLHSCVEKDNYKPEITGVLFDKENKCAVATDTRRLLVLKYPDIEVNGIVPGQTIKAAGFSADKKFLKSVKMTWDQKAVGTPDVITLHMKTLDKKDKKQDMNIGSDVIEGKFPDYKRLLIKETEYTVCEIDKHGNKESRERENGKRGILYVEEVQACFLDFHIAKHGICVDRKYIDPIMDYLNSIGETRVKIKFIAPNQQIYIESEDFTYIVMPIILN